MHTVRNSLIHAVQRLQLHTDAPWLEAELLLAHVLGGTRALLYTYPEHELDTGQWAQYDNLLKQRANGEPLPYLTGQTEFFGLGLSVNRHVLIPRPETELLVQLALDWLAVHAPLPARPVVADVGTGSGAIAVALAVHFPRVHVCAVDLSDTALEVARSNAARHDVMQQVSLLQSDLLSGLTPRLNLIVSNPPYIAAAEWPTLPLEVREHEPRLALDGGPDGLLVVERLLQQAPAHLHPGGAVLVEIGAAQGAAATRLAVRLFPRAQVAVHQDLAGRDRVLHIQTGWEQT